MAEPLFNSESERAQLVNDLRGGLDGPFWAAIKKIVSVNVANMTEQAMDEAGVLTPEQREDFRYQANQNRKLLALPERFIADLNPRPQERPNLDPYEESPKS